MYVQYDEPVLRNVKYINSIRVTNPDRKYPKAKNIPPTNVIRRKV